MDTETFHGHMVSHLGWFEPKNGICTDATSLQEKGLKASRASRASTSTKEHQCARKIQNSIISINDFVFPREANLCLQRSLSPNTYGYGYIHRYFAHNVIFIMGRRLRATHIVQSIHNIYIYICMYVCMHVCIYIYIYSFVG